MGEGPNASNSPWERRLHQRGAETKGKGNEEQGLLFISCCDQEDIFNLRHIILKKKKILTLCQYKKKNQYTIDFKGVKGNFFLHS